MYKTINHKFRLLMWLALLLATGFLATSVASYVTSRDLVRQGIREQALPLTGDNIYSEIQKDLLRPVFTSSLMANDTFLRDWIIGGEKDKSQIQRYLREVKVKYGMITSFLISESSRRYYYADGTLKTVLQSEPRDVWYFRVRNMQQPYEINVDPDLGNRDTMTIFINYRVLDFKGNFIGVTGVGLTLDTVVDIIETYQRRFQRRIYFVDSNGVIVLAGKSMQHLRGSIRDLPGIRTIAGKLLENRANPLQLEYRLDHRVVLLNSRYIPELGWHLVVEQDDAGELRPLQRVFAINIAISAGVTLLVLVITLLTVNRYQRRLERLASHDGLSGLLNRQAFEVLIQQAIHNAQRYSRPLSVVLFDLDHFKRINDTHGHLVGDEVLRQIANVTRSLVRESDAICRWGGEEFLVLLGECKLEQAAAVAEKLRAGIVAHPFGEPVQTMTASFGVVQYRPGETSISFFSRADQALYKAKNGGRNRVEALAEDLPLVS